MDKRETKIIPPKQQVVNVDEGVVIGEYDNMARQLCGHVNRGGGIIDLGNGKAIKFITYEQGWDGFLKKKAVRCTIQLLEMGIGKKVSSQTYQPSKLRPRPKAKPKPIIKKEFLESTKPVIKKSLW